MAVLAKEPLICIHLRSRFLMHLQRAPVKNDLAHKWIVAKLIMGCGTIQLAQYNSPADQSHLETKV